MILPLDKADSKGRRVYIVRLGAYDSSKYSATDFIKVIAMVLDVWLLEDDAMVVNGLVTITDLDKVTVGHASQMSVGVLKKSTTIFQVGISQLCSVCTVALCSLRKRLRNNLSFVTIFLTRKVLGSSLGKTLVV